MKKILLIITVVFLLISCSNAYIQKDFTQYEKKQLSILSNDIKNNLLKNNIKFIEENIKDSYKNRYIIDNLYKIDFTGINVFISEPSYVNVYPTSLLALNVVGADEIQLLSVVDELATNAIEHAYDYGQGEIKIVLDIYNNTVFLTVEDYGRGYTENTESKEDGGYGLFIARKLVDVLKIEKKTRGTIFKVEKKLKEAV